MKNLVKNLIATVSVFSSVAFANEVVPAKNAVIESGFMDFDSNEIVVNVRYQGGCLEQKFELNYNGCSENKSNCVADLVQTEGFGDRCRAIVQEEIRFPVQSEMIPFGQIEISGAADSRAFVQLSQVEEDLNPAIITAGAYVQKNQELVLEVQFQGGCEDHKFELSGLTCEGKSCQVQLKRTAGFSDRCKRMMLQDIVLPLDASKLKSADMLKVVGGFGSELEIGIIQ